MWPVWWVRPSQPVSCSASSDSGRIRCQNTTGALECSGRIFMYVGEGHRDVFLRIWAPFASPGGKTLGGRTSAVFSGFRCRRVVSRPVRAGFAWTFDIPFWGRSGLGRRGGVFFWRRAEVVFLLARAVFRRADFGRFFGFSVPPRRIAAGAGGFSGWAAWIK